MDRVEFLTKTYIKAFSIAMNETNNPSLAGQIAFSVTNIIAMEQQSLLKENPLFDVISNIMSGKMKDKEEGINGEDNTRQET